jgi:hypothetical protein
MSPVGPYPKAGVLFEVLAQKSKGDLAQVLSRVDPILFADTAARHGLSTYLVDLLTAAQVSFPGQNALLAQARASMVDAHRVKRLTLAVFDALAQVGVTPIALKGAVLAQRLYPSNPLSRPSSDVDVLVRPDELERVEVALQSLALRRHDDPGLADVFEEHHHLSYSGARGLVEVHFRLITSFGRGLFDDEAIRRRAVPYVFEGRAVQVLCAEDEFLYLATHAANHGFLRIAWLVDLQRLLQVTPELDFAVMRRRAEDASFRQAVTVALSLLANLLAVELPTSARTAFPRRMFRGVFDAVLFSPERVEAARWSDHRIANFFLRLWMVDDGWRGASHIVDGAKRLWRRHSTSE